MAILLDFEKNIASLETEVARLEALGRDDPEGLGASVAELLDHVDSLRQAQFSALTAYQRTMLCRHPERPFTLDYLERAFTDFTELHGDRPFMDDPSIVGGLARIGGRPVMVIGHQKGRTAKDIMARNFGMSKPEGFRKGLRLMQMAERLGRPLVTFIDTPGAYPGLGAEERGQAEAIARNIMELADLRVPVVSVVIGEGGSGGALALAVANRILMLENAMFSVISPEACASSLWRQKVQAPRAAEALRYMARDCLSIGVADEVLPEPSTGAHRDHALAARTLGEAVARHLDELSAMGPEELRADRAAKLRALGVFERRPPPGEE